MKLRWLLLPFVVLGLAYNLALPLFEGFDEGAHYVYVDAIARTGALPSLYELPSHEVSQPPLYYLLAAPLIAWIDRSDFNQVYRPNPGLDNGIVNDHSPGEMAFPPGGTVLAMRLLRLLSTLLGAVTVALAFWTAQAISGCQEIALVSAAVLAFNPKFLHLSSQFNNDIAVACASALTVWLCARLVVNTTRPRTQGWLAAGAAAGLAFTCKYNGLAMIGPLALALAWRALADSGIDNRVRMRRFLVRGAACAAGFLIAAGWLLIYNTARYGDPLAWSAVQGAHQMTARAAPLTVAEMLSRIPDLLRSYWGQFGHGIQFPGWVDWIACACGLAVAVGLAAASLRRQLPKALWVPAVAIGCSVVVFVPWLQTRTGTENSRLLAPAFSSLSVCVAYGLLSWLPASRWRLGAAVCPALAGLAAGGALFLSLVPGYAVPVYLDAREAAQWPAAGRVLFDNGIELVSASVNPARIEPGGRMAVTAYWRATRPITDVYRVSIEVRGDDGQLLGRTSALPVNGRFATTRMAVDRVFRDEYSLPISATQRAVGRVLIGWYQHRPPNTLSTLAGNAAVNAPIGQVKVRGAQPVEAPPGHDRRVIFGDGIELEGYDLTDDALTLYWRSRGTPGRDYTVFVHVLDEHGGISAQADAPVAYATSMWDPGEQIVDRREVAGLPAARAVRIGLYDPITGQRLAAAGADGAPLEENAVTLTK